MTKEEFMMLTGIDVSDGQFATISDIYMLAGDDFDKQRFCEDYKAHGESTLMYRFYKLLKDTEAKLKETEANMANVVGQLAKTREEADRYHGWWIDESDKTEALKKEYEARILELNREHTSFKDDALDVIKFIAGQL